MGGLTWQQSLLLTVGTALGTGVVGSLLAYIRATLSGRLVPRATLVREQQISDQWRAAHETDAAALTRVTEVLQQLATTSTQQVATVDRLVGAVERLQAGTARRGGHG